MDIIQDKLNSTDKSIDIRNKQITGVELKTMACRDTELTFKFIEEITTNQLEYQSEKLISELEIDESLSEERLELIEDDDLKHLNFFSDQYSEQASIKSIEDNKDYVKEDKVEHQSVQFREFLDKKGLKDVQAFTWTQINKLVTQQLSVLKETKYALQVIQIFKDFSQKVGEIKTKYGLSHIDIDDLRQIKLKNKIPENPFEGFKGINLEEQFLNPSQCLLFDLDGELIHSRVDYCKQIKSTIEALIREPIMKLPFQNNESFTFAPVKGLERSYTKLIEYQNKALRAKSSTPVSVLQHLKDLLRCSVITKNPAETAQVVSCLEDIPGMSIIEQKNGFNPKNLMVFDPTQYADIKIVLKVDGKQYGLRYDEIIEVQVIQDINIKLKKLEHKIQDFTREESTLLNNVKYNKELAEKLKTFMTGWDENAASFVNNSTITKLSFVKDRLADQYPSTNYQTLNEEQIIGSRQTWRNGYQDQLCNRLDVLKIAQGSFDQLKIVQFQNKQELDFKIKFENLNDMQKDQFENARNRILKEEIEFGDELSKQIRNWFRQKDKNFVNCLIESSDGQYLFIASGKVITKLNAKTGILIQKYEYHTKTIECLALSEDGLYLYSGSSDGIIKQHTESGIHMRNFRHQFGMINALSLSKDGLDLYSGSSDGFIVKQNTKTGQKLVTQFNLGVEILCLALSKDGKCLQAGTSTGTVLKQSSHEDRKLFTFRHHTARVNCLELSEDGLHLYSGSNDNTIVKQNSVWGQKVNTFYNHKSQVQCLALSQNGTELYSGSLLKVVKQNTTSGQRINDFNFHSGSINCVTLSRDGRILYSGGLDKMVVKQKTALENNITKYDIQSKPVLSLAVSKDGQHLYSGSEEGIVRQNTMTGEKIVNGASHNDMVFQMAVSANGDDLYSGSLQTVVKQSTVAGKKIETYLNQCNLVTSIVLSENGKLIQLGCIDGTVVKFDCGKNQKSATWHFHNAKVTSLAISKDGKDLYSGSNDMTIVKQDTSTGNKIATFENQRSQVLCLALSQNGHELQSGSSKTLIVKQNTTSGQLLLVFKVNSEIKSLALQEDLLVVALGHGQISIFQNSKGIHVKNINISSYGILSMALHNVNSKQVFQVGDRDGNIFSIEN